MPKQIIHIRACPVRISLQSLDLYSHSWSALLDATQQETFQRRPCHYNSSCPAVSNCITRRTAVHVGRLKALPTNRQWSRVVHVPRRKGGMDISSGKWIVGYDGSKLTLYRACNVVTTLSSSPRASGDYGMAAGGREETCSQEHPCHMAHYGYVIQTHPPTW